MTEQERLERQKKWVELRADCTVEGAFDQIVEAIECDVVRFNELPEKRCKGRRFKCSRETQQRAYIAQVDEDGELIKENVSNHVEKNHFKILVRHNGDLAFEVEPKWNEETLACDLKIGGNAYSVFQISQKAIGDLLFGHV